MAVVFPHPLFPSPRTLRGRRGLFSRPVLPDCRAYCLLILGLVTVQGLLMVSTNWMRHCNLSTWKTFVFSLLEYSLDTVNFLYTWLQLSFVNGSLNRLFQCILDIVYMGGLVTFTVTMINTSYVQLGVNPYSNVVFFRAIRTLSPTWNLVSVAFRAFTSSIMHVFIVCWITCICRYQLDRSMICIVILLSHTR